jgi:hypothetical protein
MCEACARKLLELAFDAKPLPDQQGDGRISSALERAAAIIQPISENEDWKHKYNEVKETMLRYENRCFKMAASLYTFIHGKRTDGTSINPIIAITEAKSLLGERD